MQGDGIEVPPQLKVRLDPQVPLTHRNEGHDVLDLIRVEVLQLDLVVVQQPPKEWMRGDCEPALMEGCKGDDVTVGWHCHILVPGNLELHRVGPPTKKTTLDEALHACVGDVGAIP